MTRDPQLENRRQILTDAAALIRLLGQVRLAQMLEDDSDRMNALLDQVRPTACENMAHVVELEAARLRPELGHSPSAPGNELVSPQTRELAPAGDMLSDLGVA